jgi:hypothetical protein
MPERWVEIEWCAPARNYTADFAVMGRKVQNWSWVPDLVPRFRDLWLEK